MQSLNIAKNRSSFIPYVATDNTEQKSKLHFFMNRIFGGQIDFLTPFNPRVQTVRFKFFKVYWPKWVAYDPI